MGLSLIGTLLLLHGLVGQGAPGAGRPAAGAPADHGGPLAEPQPSRVYQRDRNDRADIPVVLRGEPGKASIAEAMLIGTDGNAVGSVAFRDGALRGVPTGGPYRVQVQLEAKPEAVTLDVGPVFVGDLWVLAGQSNMEGVGDLVDVTPPDDRVMCLGMDGRWARAEEPLHWLVDSPDPVHSGDAATRAERSEKAHRARAKGAGLGLPFAVEMVQATQVPVGLVACAHGGTSMLQWSPDKKDEGGKSLYGSMIRQFRLAGGKAKGLLWYQGESDANEKAAQAYPGVFADFIAAVRRDFDQPDLPFYLVQIGRFIRPGDPRDWNAVQEAQRRIPDRVPNTAVVSVIDLELDDLIHVGTQGLKRAGRRLALVALHELFGRPLGTTPTLDRVARGANNTLLITFKGVNPGGDVGLVGRGQGGRGMGGMGMGMGMGGMAGMGMSGRGMAGMAMASISPTYGLRPELHIGGFSIRKVDGTEIPLIFEAAVGKARDTVVLKLTGKVPEGANLWYGWGFDPYCNLVDGADMAVPVFGPIPLDDVR